MKRILQKFIVAKGDKEMIAGAFDELEPIITAANIGINTIYAIHFGTIWGKIECYSFVFSVPQRAMNVILAMPSN